MEKADILQMTVSHLRDVQHRQMALDRGSDVTSRYVAGYAECAKEVSAYLQNVKDVDSNVQGRLMGHLANYIETSVARNVDTSPIATASTALPGMRVVSPGTAVSGVMSMAVSPQGVPVFLQPATVMVPGSSPNPSTVMVPASSQPTVMVPASSQPTVMVPQSHPGTVMVPAGSPHQHGTNMDASGAIPLYVTSPASTSSPVSSPASSPASSTYHSRSPSPNTPLDHTTHTLQQHKLEVLLHREPLKREPLSPHINSSHNFVFRNLVAVNKMEECVWRPW